MRIVRPGVMPSEAAAACSAVVLNGVGGATLRLLLLGGGDGAGLGCRDGLHDALRLGFALEAVGGVPGRELGSLGLAALGPERALHRPVDLRDERLALELARHDQRERRRLHASGRLHVAVAGELGHRQVAREHGAPHQVDVLARLAGLREALVDLDELRERTLDLVLGDRREPRALDRRLLVDVANERCGIAADELALAVEVGRDDDLVGLLGSVLQRADELALGGHLADRGPDQVRERRQLPALEVDPVDGERLLALLPRRRGKRRRDGRGHGAVVFFPHGLPRPVGEDHLRWEVHAEDVALEADGHPVLAVGAEGVDGRVVDLLGLGLAHRKDLGELLGGDVLLGDDELQRETTFPGAAFWRRLYTGASSPLAMT